MALRCGINKYNDKTVYIADPKKIQFATFLSPTSLRFCINKCQGINQKYLIFYPDGYFFNILS